MFKVADPAYYTEPFQDGYGIINVPLGWFGPLTVHVTMTYLNDNAKTATFTNIYPQGFTQKFYNTSLGTSMMSCYADKPADGIMWWHSVSAGKQNVVLKPGEKKTVPFFDLYLTQPFDAIPAIPCGVNVSPAYNLRVGMTSWADPTAMSSKCVLSDSGSTPVIPQGGNSIPIDDFTTEPGDVGQNNVDILVDVDIKPGDAIGAINRQSKGVIPVLIEFGTTYNVMDIDPGSVLFAGTYPVKWHYTGNGLILHFDTQRCRIPDGATSLSVIGRFVNGSLFHGADAVKIVK
jgi:hypothetical protein